MTKKGNNWIKKTLKTFLCSIHILAILLLPSILCGKNYPSALPALSCKHPQTAAVRRCCKFRQNCPQKIGPFQFGPGNIFNGDRGKDETRYHCDCEVKLRLCLRKARSDEAQSFGHFFFNVQRIKCFKKGRPQRCKKGPELENKFLSLLLKSIATSKDANRQRPLKQLAEKIHRKQLKNVGLSSGRGRRSGSTSKSSDNCRLWAEKNSEDIRYRFYRPDYF